MASASTASPTAPTTTSSKQSEGFGNLRFCSYCQNLMLAKFDKEKKSLYWECSIECSGSKQTTAEAITSLTVLSETTDDGSNVHQNPVNDFTRDDPTLLRCLRRCQNTAAHEDDDDPDQLHEMIIFKENIATAKSYFICTDCGAHNQRSIK